MPKCKYCDKELTSLFGRRKVFCSNECRIAFYDTKKKGERFCIVCGKELPSRRRSYCSDECRYKGIIAFQREKNKEEYKKPKAEEKPKKRGRPKKGLSLEQAAKLAKQEGISWGEYYQKHRLWEKER